MDSGKRNIHMFRPTVTPPIKVHLQQCFYNYAGFKVSIQYMYIFVEFIQLIFHNVLE